MTDEKLKEIQQQLFFELNVGKIDIYHFERIKEIVVVRHGDTLEQENILKVFKY